MTEESKTIGDQGNKGDAPPQPPETISKADHDKLKLDFEQMKSAKEKAEGELLSPEYLAHLETKEKPPKPPTASELPADIESMSRKELVEYMRTGLRDELADFSKTHLTPIRGSIEELRARAEVGRCEKIYTDFNDYRTDMVSLLRNNDGLGIEDAYKVAKQNKKIEKDTTEREAAAKAISEKPGGPSGSSASPREFKSAEAASDDAWDKVMGNKTTL